MEQVYDLHDVRRATKLSTKTIRKYIEILKIDPTQYSAGKLQVSSKDLKLIKKYAKEQAAKTRKNRRDSMLKNRFQHS